VEEKPPEQKPKGTATERMRELVKHFVCWPKWDWPPVDHRDTNRQPSVYMRSCHPFKSFGDY